MEQEKTLFYSQDWQRTRIMAISNLPRFDILITNNFLYLISLPASSLSQLGIMGGLLPALLANSLDKKARNKGRSNWLDQNGEFISRDYEKHTLLKIPQDKLKESITMKKVFRQRLAIFTYNGEKITLQGSKKEYERLGKFMEN